MAQWQSGRGKLSKQAPLMLSECGIRQNTIWYYWTQPNVSSDALRLVHAMRHSSGMSLM